jgi:phosphoheptose isomerase
MGKFSKTWFAEALASVSEDAVYQAANIMAHALKAGGNILVMGNGGSLAVAEHFASDLVKGIQQVNACLSQVTCLGSNQVLFSAIANDEGYDQVFVHQLMARSLGVKDVIVTFSVSGSSPNIVATQKYAVDTFNGKSTWQPDSGPHVIDITGQRATEPVRAFLDSNVHRIVVTTGLEQDDHFAAVEGVFSCLGHMIARIIAKERE